MKYHLLSSRPALLELAAPCRRRARARMVALLVMVCSPFVCSDVSAAYYPFEGRLIGSVEADGLHLQIHFDWGYNVWGAAPAGIDVYRRPIAVGCGSWELITNEPVAWSWQDVPNQPHLSFEVVDVTAQPNHGYEYQAHAVDANRNSIPEDPDAYLGVATHGIALLGHGTLYGGPGGCGESYVQILYDCAQECFPPLRFDAASEVIPYINSGTPVLVYGVITDVRWTCQMNETIAYFYSAAPAGCVVAVEPSTWGYVKSLYR